MAMALIPQNFIQIGWAVFELSRSQLCLTVFRFLKKIYKKVVIGNLPKSNQFLVMAMARLPQDFIQIGWAVFELSRSQAFMTFLFFFYLTENSHR